MLSRAQLRRIARARIKDAQALLEARRYDGAVYLCGYAVELALKARIVAVLKWPGFPETNNEFKGLQSFKVHELDALLHLSGSETKIKVRYLAEWSAVAQWDPEARYKPIGTAKRSTAALMIQSARTLLKAL